MQVYHNERTFLNTLEGYAGTGLLAGESVIVIATASHLSELNERLTAQGFDLASLIKAGLYIPLDAVNILGKFFVDGVANKTRFLKTIQAVYKKAKSQKVRAFGEMVVPLWEQGNKKAALKLEELWNLFMSNNPLTLFCAYPDNLLAGTANVASVCCRHSRMVAGWPHASTEVYYSDPV